MCDFLMRISLQPASRGVGADVSYLRAPLCSAVSGVSVKKRPKSRVELNLRSSNVLPSRDVTFRFHPRVKNGRITSCFPACLEENSPSVVISDTNLTEGGGGRWAGRFLLSPEG